MAIAIIGLGYVGLPLAIQLSKHYRVIGFDVDRKRIEELKCGFDRTGEIENLDNILDWIETPNIKFTCDPHFLSEASVFIICVPTPVNEYENPVLDALIEACWMIGKHIKQDDLVIFESTVYPGCTESICKDILESRTGGKAGEFFHLGFSPERINPGDKEHTITKMVKLIASDTAIDRMEEIYGKITTVCRAENIKTAEAAKIIENVQRDVNIALMNEFAVICDNLGIRSQEALKAASTKWNFLNFKPGLVGGHCIGVDPYYLAHAAKGVKVHPHMTLAGRQVNDGMAEYIAKVIAQKSMSDSIGILGYTFKANVPDTRNTKVLDLYNSLIRYGFDVNIHDPYIAGELDGINFVGIQKLLMPDTCIILAVNHTRIMTDPYFLDALQCPGIEFVDLTQSLDPDRCVWSL